MNKRAAAPPAPTHEWVRCREVGCSAPQAPPGKARAGAVEAAAASGPAPGARATPSPILLYQRGGGRRWNPPPPPPHLDSSLPLTRSSQGPLQPSLPGQNPAWTLLGRSRRVLGALCLSPSRATHHAGGAETRFEGAPANVDLKGTSSGPAPQVSALSRSGSYLAQHQARGQLGEASGVRAASLACRACHPLGTSAPGPASRPP